MTGAVTTWNPAAERMYGYSAGEMIGGPILAIVPPDRQAEFEEMLQLIRDGRFVPSYETVLLAKHGPPVEVAVTMSAIRDSAGSVTGASAIARDITEQRWLARTLDSTLRALEGALDEARAAEERSRRFLADAAHQLRTPMAGIRACAETLLRGPLGNDRDRLLTEMVRETSRASRLIASLLLMARLDQGEPLAPTECDLGAVCEEELRRARSLAPHLEFTMTTDGPPAAADPAAVREILANLLDNARRHARSRVTVTVGGCPEGVEIRVGDDGDGLPAGVEERVFERFVSLDGGGGSGLGLPIARGLARASGGDLRYGGGAFVLRLPSASPVTSADPGVSQ